MGGVSLNTDVENLNSHRRHPSSCLKPPEVPVASRIQCRLATGAQLPLPPDSSTGAPHDEGQSHHGPPLPSLLGLGCYP